ncbi:PREDICTED: GDSL esterase/lipase At5g62930-like isoform X2 [Tarenaya hassleriana]|uniref:GDSL esterase/lipase At5g62930-like isoform X2 n=1 Tax=Tarenaya hassleriana TaxID=28532 RepID=UPI00053CA9AC|nr:PREDICTED: GDSL esterase/lipase At5g62930-like isoform X2 [Tarenaya hassleriana]
MVFVRPGRWVVRGYGGYNARWTLFLLHHTFPLDSSSPPSGPLIGSMYLWKKPKKICSASEEVFNYLASCAYNVTRFQFMKPGIKAMPVMGLHLLDEGNALVHQVSKMFREAWLSPGKIPGKAFEGQCS